MQCASTYVCALWIAVRRQMSPKRACLCGTWVVYTQSQQMAQQQLGKETTDRSSHTPSINDQLSFYSRRLTSSQRSTTSRIGRHHRRLGLTSQLDFEGPSPSSSMGSAPAGADEMQSHISPLQDRIKVYKFRERVCMMMHAKFGQTWTQTLSSCTSPRQYRHRAQISYALASDDSLLFHPIFSCPFQSCPAHLHAADLLRRLLPFHVGVPSSSSVSGTFRTWKVMDEIL